MRNFTFLFFCLALTSLAVRTSAQTNLQDSMALVDFFNATDGNNWSQNNNWNSDQPVNTWYGVTISGGRVTSLEMWGNQISGELPESFGDLTALTKLSLIDNRITGTLPASFANLTSLVELHLGANPLSGNIPEYFGNFAQLQSLNLYSNFMTGSIPASLANVASLKYLDVQYSGLSGPIPTGFIREDFTFLIAHNKFTFGDLEPYISLSDPFEASHPSYVFDYTPQGNLPILRDNNTLIVLPGGTPSNLSIEWYRNGDLLSTGQDTTLHLTNPGHYQARVMNTQVPALELWSDTFLVNPQLPTGNVIVSQTINGSSPVNITSELETIATLTPAAGPDGLSGDVTVMLHVQNDPLSYQGTPFVSKHYDIIPAVNAAGAKAVVKLFFSEADFENYNILVANAHPSMPLLPQNKIDNGSLRVYQFHGDFAGSPEPGNYAGGTEKIVPDVLWNDSLSWWEVSFSVTGFSGFFISSAASILPLKLVSFSGKSSVSGVGLQWMTTEERNTKSFVVQKRVENGFRDIALIAAKSSPLTNAYEYLDAKPFVGNNLYRLKIVDHDGRFDFSSVISVMSGNRQSSLSVFPNPASKNVVVRIHSDTRENVLLSVVNSAGMTVMTSVAKAQKGVQADHSINVENLAAGTYYIHAMINGKGEVTSFIKH